MSEALWFGSSKHEYDSSNARYYNTGNFSWVRDIENSWPGIKKEVTAFIQEKDAGFQSNSGSYKGIEGNGWSSLSALFWGLKVSESLEKKCPTLFSKLYSIPGITSISFSRLEPNTTLSEHHGETNAIMRCHLGIEVPAPHPICSMKVAGEERGWEEGKWFLFNDAQHHSAWNKSDKRRIVLIIDVVRPEFLHLKNLVCARVLTGHFMTIRENKGGLLKKLPRSGKMIVFICALPIVYILRPIYNMLHLNRMYHE